MESQQGLLAVKNWLIDLVFPRICISCGKPEGNLCNDCRKLTKFVLGSKTVQDIDELIFIWHYDNRIVKSLISSFKYDFITDLDNDLRYFLNQDECSKKLRFFCSSGYLVPVPLHKGRELWRGFNQSRVIAQIISEIVGVSVRNDIVRRAQHTEQQAHLGLNDRLLNLKGVFRVNKLPNSIETVILVDDVVTTGATLSSIAQELKKAGVLRVKAVVLAA